MMYDLVFLFVGLLVGALGVYLLMRAQVSASALLLAQKEEQFIRELNAARKEAVDSRQQAEQQRDKAVTLQTELALARQEYSTLQSRMNEQKAELEALQERFRKEFENLANKILDEKTKKFTEQNENQLRGLLDPLKDRIRDFEKRVNETHNESEKERSALKEQLRMLSETNKRMSEEALNLTRALKGDSKQQGNWGELILEKILEKSGLVRGREYDVQQSFTNEEGSRLQPDVLLRLPDDKVLIIDSKVSLVAYERYAATDDENLKAQYLKEHVASLRAHVRGLSGKSYQNLHRGGSLDFVLLFVPIEPAFSLALQSDFELYNEAFEKNVVMVSPTTLLATLRAVANVWKQENIKTNYLEIARQGGDMYDKFVGFVEDLIKVGKLMDDSKKVYSEAMNKLTEGRGNLVRRAENMKELSQKASKNLPQALIDRSKED
ncbi:MAG: DNA recombination protein RmuC [Chitinophagales bacterium]